jgi:uncharacterized membrane protein YhiD involved in acid resistance
MELINNLILENYIQNSVMLSWNIVFSILLSIVCGLFIALVHRKNSTNLVYDPQINFSLVFLTMIITVVMIVIGSNLALSLGLIGALSIIRFRTAIKNTIDISFIFWAIATGLALGSYNYLLAIIEIIAIGIVIIVASRFLLLNKKNNEYIIILQLAKDIESTSHIDNVISKIVNKFDVKSYIQLDEYFEYSIFARCDESEISVLMHKMQSIDKVNNISILYPNTNIYI